MTPHFSTPEAAITHSSLSVGPGEFIEFEGHNCDEVNPEANCRGWDGWSHRCDCCNRRVCWGTSGYKDTGFHAYAMAY